MDEQVLQAMSRWPDVPAMFGWLRLDRRGHWHLIDRQRPGFDEACDGIGSPITSPSIIDFIARNFEHDAQGRWYWQNGPQRVFVDLDVAPLIVRVMDGGDRSARLITHCGDPCTNLSAVAVSADGNLWLATERGPGIVHDLDLGQLDIEMDERTERPLRLRLDERWHDIELLSEPKTAPEWAQFVARPRAEKI